KLPYGTGKDIAQEFGISRTTVFRHLKAYDFQKADGQPTDLYQGCQRRCGRPNAVTDPWEVPSISRTSYRKWAVKSGIPLSSLWCLCKRVRARKHKRWVKPVLSEKWFYMMKDGKGIYLHPEEDAPKPPRAQNKRFITKVMFLTAVAWPMMISDEVWFDGKIGIWPIADTVAAMRSSKNRKKGTMMLKPATINAERYK
ncbi:unnamed protein product, partial [Discosporangium mesarthrocarpum]